MIEQFSEKLKDADGRLSFFQGEGLAQNR